MKKVFAFVFLAIIFCSCTERMKQDMGREWQFSDRNYTITVFSGGKTVFTDSIHGIVNQEEGSDGLFYFKGDTLIEISGEYVVKSLK